MTTEEFVIPEEAAPIPGAQKVVKRLPDVNKVCKIKPGEVSHGSHCLVLGKSPILKDAEVWYVELLDGYYPENQGIHHAHIVGDKLTVIADTLEEFKAMPKEEQPVTE